MFYTRKGRGQGVIGTSREQISTNASMQFCHDGVVRLEYGCGEYREAPDVRFAFFLLSGEYGYVYLQRRRWSASLGRTACGQEYILPDIGVGQLRERCQFLFE